MIDTEIISEFKRDGISVVLIRIGGWYYATTTRYGWQTEKKIRRLYESQKLGHSAIPKLNRKEAFRRYRRMIKELIRNNVQFG